MNGAPARAVGAVTEREVLQDAVFGSPLLGPVLKGWSDVQLPDAWLVAGAVAQAVWNARLHYAPGHGLRDIDIVYHDPDDLSEATEESHAVRIRALFAECPARFDVKNEARVHCWYEAKFGYPIAPYPSVAAAIATFPTTATTVGIRPGSAGLDVIATHGLSDLCNLVVRPNRVQVTRRIYEAKVARWQTLWPTLHIEKW